MDDLTIKSPQVSFAYVFYFLLFPYTISAIFFITTISTIILNISILITLKICYRVLKSVLGIFFFHLYLLLSKWRIQHHFFFKVLFMKYLQVEVGHGKLPNAYEYDIPMVDKVVDASWKREPKNEKLAIVKGMKLVASMHSFPKMVQFLLSLFSSKIIKYLISFL